MAEADTLANQSELQNYINGDWQAINGDSGQSIVNPATQEEMGYVPFSNNQDIDKTIEQAREAFEDWHQRAVEERIQPMFRLKQLLEENIDNLTETLVQEHGKTYAEARGELRRGIENVEVACGIPTMMQAGNLPNAAPDIDEKAVRKPLGVFAAVTPFNFPGMIPLWFLPYAVATGNSFILKPSERDPLTAQKLFELIDEAGFPDGVVNLVHGSADTVNALIEHEGIEGISFVGSTPVAEHIYQSAAANGKRVQAQGGAKNHIIVTESADLEFAAEQTVSSSYACSGERCLANDVAVVEENIYEEFIDLVVEKADEQVVGYGLDDDTDIGPLISSNHKESILEHIDSGIEEGATMIRDGRDVSVEGYEDGNFLGPTVFRDVAPEMRIVREEIFGPVLGLMSASDFDDAINTVNKSDFGNAASLFTGDGAKARKFRQDVEAGNLGVNIGTAAPMAFFHFGGRKDSFFGDLHAQGEDMIQFYTDKSIYIERWPDT